MALPIWLCGAVPIQVDPGRADANLPVLMCCHCHVIDSMAPLQTRLLEPQQQLDYGGDGRSVDYNLPDVVPRDKSTSQEETDSHVKEVISPQPDADPHDKSAAHWKDVGRDLRRIADQFQSSRRQDVSGGGDSSSWIQTCLLNGLAAFVGWRIQRWISG